MRVESFRPWLPIVTLGVILAIPGLATGLPSHDQKQADTNSIEVVVDGELRKTWSVGELMQGRFDWLSPSGTFFPAIPALFPLTSQPLGFSLQEIEGIRFVSGRRSIEIEGSSLELLHELVLKVDLDRGGTWQLVGRHQEADHRLVEIAGVDRLRRVTRIEVRRRPN